jgi:hypothetical protein
MCILYVAATVVLARYLPGQHDSSIWAGVMVKALRYYSDSLEIDSRWCQSLGIFSLATDGTMCLGVDSVSKNEYQEFLLGQGGRCVRLTTYHPRSPERQENPEPLGPAWPVVGDLYLYRHKD